MLVADIDNFISFFEWYLDNNKLSRASVSQYWNRLCCLYSKCSGGQTMPLLVLKGMAAVSWFFH
jgi:hypothetical protein